MEALGNCPVCPSPLNPALGVLSKEMDGSSWFLACRLFSTYLTLCYKEIQVSAQMRVLPSGTLPQTPDFILYRRIDRRNVL